MVISAPGDFKHCTELCGTMGLPDLVVGILGLLSVFWRRAGGSGNPPREHEVSKSECSTRPTVPRLRSHSTLGAWIMIGTTSETTVISTRVRVMLVPPSAFAH